jgi:hypothetical protein
MGWTHTNRPSYQTPTEFIKEHFSWEGEKYTCKVIETSVKLDVAFAAVERIEKATGNREVWALVLLLHHMPKSYYNFGYKDMDETMGPYRYDCPAKILDLLTPTDNEYALKWRAECRKRLSQKVSMPAGTIVKFDDELDDWGNTFVKVKHTRKHVYRSVKTGSYVRLKNSLDFRKFTIIGKEVAA